MSVLTETASFAPVAQPVSGGLLSELLDWFTQTDPAAGLPLKSPAPDFQLVDAEGLVTNSLDGLLKKGPLVVSFYQGGWSPFCTAHLQTLERAFPKISALGGSLLGVTPESRYRAVDTVERHQLSFPVLTDLDNRIARRFGNAFPVPASVGDALRQAGIYLTRHNRSERAELPLPATFVIHPDRTIGYVARWGTVNQPLYVREILTAVYRVRQR